MHYFNVTAPGVFTPAQQAAVEGTQDTSVCGLWDVTFAQGGNPSDVDAADRFRSAPSQPTSGRV